MLLVDKVDKSTTGVTITDEPHVIGEDYANRVVLDQVPGEDDGIDVSGTPAGGGTFVQVSGTPGPGEYSIAYNGDGEGGPISFNAADAKIKVTVDYTGFGSWLYARDHNRHNRIIRSLDYNLWDWGALGLGEDYTEEIQACLDAAGASAGLSRGEASANVYAPPGEYLFSEGLIVPHHVKFYGAGRSKTFMVGQGLADDTKLIRLGEPSRNRVFASRLEDMTLLDDATPGSIGVYSNSINEQGGVFRCVIRAQHRGILIDSEDGGLPAHYTIRDIEVLMNLSGADSDSVGIEVSSPGGYSRVEDSTVIGDLSQVVIKAGIWARGHRVRVSTFHPEGCVDGVLVGDAGGGYNANGCLIEHVNGPSANASVTNLIHIEADAQGTTLAALTRAQATNLILDESTVPNRTYSQPNAGIYVVGTGPKATRTVITDINGEPARYSGNVETAGDVVAAGNIEVDNVDAAGDIDAGGAIRATTQVRGAKFIPGDAVLGTSTDVFSVASVSSLVADTSSALVSIGGLNGGFDHQSVTVTKLSPDYPLIFRHNKSGVDNAIITPNGKDLVLNRHGGVTMRYDQDNNRWVILSVSTGFTESSESSDLPIAADWEPGDLVAHTDTGDGSGTGLYLLGSDGTTWTKLDTGILGTREIEIDPLTDSTGGTASSTVSAVSGTSDDAGINDALASLTAKVNEMQAEIDTLLGYT